MAGPVNEFGVSISGTTAQRPINAEICARYWDTQTESFLVWDGSEWVKAATYDSNGNLNVGNVIPLFGTAAEIDVVLLAEGAIAIVDGVSIRIGDGVTLGGNPLELEE